MTTTLAEIHEDFDTTTVRPLIPTQVGGPVDQLTRRALAMLRRQTGRLLVTGGPGISAEVAQRIADREPHLAHRADCFDVHELARVLLRHRGIDITIDIDGVEEAWQAAWARVGQHTVLTSLDRPQRWRAEVSGAIKGRGVTRVREYKAHPAAITNEVWDLYVAYSEELAIRFTHDLDDLVAIAYDEVTREPPTQRYAAVLIDPGAGLTPAMVRLLRAVTSSS